jgi:organic hydroperoxide reductase OsmC/OhrA
MKAYPHHYRVAATAGPEGDVILSSAGLDSLHSAPPLEFDGPGDLWSPESLLTAAIADCFILTFRAIARAGKLPWVSLECDVEGTLEREPGMTRFTEFTLRAQLGVPAGTDIEAAQRALHKAEQGCLISNSLSSRRLLTTSVDIVA